MPTDTARLPEGYESMVPTLQRIQEAIPHRRCRSVLVDLNVHLTLRIDRLHSEIRKAKAEMLVYEQGTSGRQYLWQERIAAERQLVEVQSIHRKLRESLDRMECPCELCPTCGGGDAG